MLRLPFHDLSLFPSHLQKRLLLGLQIVEVLSFVSIVQVVRRLVMEKTYDRKVKERPLAFQRPPPPKAEVERKAHLASS